MKAIIDWPDMSNHSKGRSNKIIGWLFGEIEFEEQSWQEYFQDVKYTGKSRFKVLYRREGVIKFNVKTKLLGDLCEIINIRMPWTRPCRATRY